MMTLDKMLLFTIIIFSLLFLFHLFLLKKKISRGDPLYTIIYISLLFIIALFSSFLRIQVVPASFLFLGGVILSVGGEQALSLPAPSGSEGSSSWTGKTSFEEQVLLEPFPEAEATSANSSVARDEGGPSQHFRNSSFESSLRSRIIKLEGEGSIFLLDKDRGEYWADIKRELDQAPSSTDYYSILEFENRDLQIREKKHQCLSLFQQQLSQRPDLAANIAYNPEEALCDFVDEKRKNLDTCAELDLKGRDTEEMVFLDQVAQKIRSRGPAYVSEILNWAVTVTGD